MNLEMEEDFNGADVENSYLRRLYRVLYLPTTDLMHNKVDQKKEMNRLKKEREEQ